MSEPDYIERGAVFSDDGLHRFRLWRRWSGSSQTAIFIMLNPSTADAEKLDPTVRRCVSFARRWGCGGIEVLNLFSLRATNPKQLYKTLQCNHPDNDWHHDLILRDHQFDAAFTIVAAWGAHGNYLGRGVAVAKRVIESGRTLSVLAFNKDGTPKHPLYVKSDVKLNLWNGG